jgi:hypothetical protein
VAFFVRDNYTRPTLKKAPDGESASLLTFVGNDPRHPAASSPSGGFFFA